MGWKDIHEHIDNDRLVFIDASGKMPFKLEMSEGEIAEVGDFSDGLAWFKIVRSIR